MNEIKTLIFSLLIYLTSFASVVNDIGVQENTFIADSLRKTTVVPNDSALLVFVSDSMINISSNVDSIKPIRDNRLNKVLIPIGKNIITLKCKGQKIDLNCGTALGDVNKFPIINNREIRVFNVKLLSRIKCPLEQEGQLNDLSIPELDKSSMQNNARLIFKPQFQKYRYSFSSSIPIIAIKNETPGEYDLIVKAEMQLISVYCHGFDTGYVQIGTIQPHMCRTYGLYLPLDENELMAGPSGPKPSADSTPHRKIILDLMSNPSGAQVFFDPNATQAGHTPFRVEISQFGNYRFVFKKPSFQPIDTTVQITGNWRNIDTVFANLKSISSNYLTSQSDKPIPETFPLSGNKNKKKYGWVISFAGLSLFCCASGIASNYYADKKYNAYKKLNAESSSSKYDESWKQVETYKNLRNGFYIASGCFGGLCVIKFPF